ncbi:origin recognition complex subunit 4 [Malassezia vespertilionis]|uniref:origin recognition complex subunit 4 n=1 Tax=Malassezia vespertilionis TaxID=2020962 RepID=UPI0024B14CF2|nr:origin recognition complex subunit 4 [Malassezia vespertilionis]WFD04787.1 origin recognition complex subunit 4 [Malassezia vespertilionis]
MGDAAWAAQKKRTLAVLSTAPPPPAACVPYHGQECIGLEDSWVSLYALLRGTIVGQEGNSCLLIGEHGCGKSLLMQSTLRRIGEECVRYSVLKPLVVSLPGLLYTTDRQCIAELARQLMQQGALGRTETDEAVQQMEEKQQVDEMPEAQEDAGAGSDSDDDARARTETHAKAMQPSVQPSAVVTNAILLTMATALSHILSLLSRTAFDAPAARPLVIVLDDFEQYTARPRQALLYCLLDAVQAASYGPGLIVVGMTTRVDAGDALEKRVKSRFSQRTFHIHPPSLETYTQIARAALLGGLHVPPYAPWATEVEIIPVAALTVPTLDAATFLHCAKTQREDAQRAAMHDLTEAELAVLIAARHLQLQGKEPFTFEMCFRELDQFVQRVRRDLRSGQSAHIHGISRGTVAIAGIDALANRTSMMGVCILYRYLRKAFQRLLALEMLVPEPARLSLALAAGVASRTGAATSAYGTLANASVVPEFLPVRTAMPARMILEGVQDQERPEPPSAILLQWAEGTGM